MNKIEAVALRIVPSIRAVAKAHTRHAALLVLAAACLFLGGVVRAADTSAAARNARMLAAQQQRIEQNPLPTDLVAVQLNQVPRTVNSLFSLSHWPFCPPLPAACASSYPDSPLYLSPSLNALFVDDRQREALAAAMAAADLPPIPGGTNDYGTYDDPGPSSGPRVDYSTNYTDLYLTISSATNGVAQLVLHNTSDGVPYEVVSSESLTNALSTWTSEGIWLAVSTNTPASVAIGSRTNQLFFDAHAWSGTFDHGVPTNGQLFLLVNTNSIYPVINGVTNNLTPFYGNWVKLDPPLYQVNLGYGADDNGFTNDWIQKRPEQGVLKLVGFSTTCSNLCLSYNPIQPDLDVSGWPALQDLECWECRNDYGLYHVNCTNCPSLARVCVEDCNLWWSLDFTGCPKIGDIRAALNEHMHGLIFDEASKANVWHLCIREDSGFDAPKDYDLTGFPQMRQLWMWNGGFTHDLNYPAAGTPTKLESVQAYGNAIRYADFSGQTNLQLLEIYDGETLTNINISGCKRLGLVDLDKENLSQGAVDHVLTNLVSTGITSSDYLTNTAGQHLPPTVDLRANASPSQAGLAAVVTLSNRGWNVYYDAPPVVPNTNCVTGTAPIWFANTSTTLRMQVYLAENYDAVTWYVGNTSKICGALEINVAVPIGSSNCVIVDPPSALLAFGVAGPNCSGLGAPTTKLSSVWGLTNYPNLQQLYLYGTDLNYVSLAGCTNLTAIALTGTAPSSTNVISAWFTDLLAAQTNTTITPVKWFGCASTDAGWFYYPATPGLNTDAQNALVPLHSPIGWSFYHP